MAKYIPYTEILTRVSNKIITNPDVLEASNLAGKFLRLVIKADQQRGYLGNIPVDGLDPGKQGQRDDISLFSKKSSVTPVPRKLITVDKIRIIDLDFSKGEGKTYDYIELPTVPSQLSYGMDSKFNALSTVGRNNPYYHYTGSQDTLKFKIDWFSETFHREDVIWACRWLETLTKANGDSNPHRVHIQWGKDDKLFSDDTWLLTNASYDLSLFNRNYRNPENKDEVISTSLLPTQAYQEVEFKRITQDSRTYKEIMGGITNDFESLKNSGSISGGNTV